MSVPVTRDTTVVAPKAIAIISRRSGPPPQQGQQHADRDDDGQHPPGNVGAEDALKHRGRDQDGDQHPVPPDPGRRCGGGGSSQIERIRPRTPSSYGDRGLGRPRSLGRFRPGLAARAPPGASPLGVVRHLGDHLDQGAGSAGRAGANRPLTQWSLTTTVVARGDLEGAGARAECRSGADGQPDRGGQIHLADGRPRADAAQEAQLVHPQVAQPGEVPLVQQGGGDRSIGVGAQSANGFARSQSSRSGSGPR